MADDNNPGTGEGGGTGEGNPPAISQEIEQAIRSTVDATLNNALTNHVKRLRASQEQEFTKAIKAATEPLAEQLSKLTTGGIGGGTGDKGKGDSNGENAELKRAMAEIEKLKQANQEAERRVAETEQQRLRSEERNSLGEVLGKVGIDKSRVRAAVALLYNEDKVVGRSEDGNIVFKVQRQGYTDELSLEEGVAEWLKSDEGKAFLPPRGITGSGTTSSQHQRRTGKPNSKEERLAEARRTLLNACGVNVGGE